VQAIPCDLCKEETAVLMQSNLNEGDTIAVGPSCMLPFALQLAIAAAQTVTPEAGPLYAPMVAQLAGFPIWEDPAAQDAQDGAQPPADDAGGPAAKPDLPKRRRSSKTAVNGQAPDSAGAAS
jgi:hypothetical protein